MTASDISPDVDPFVDHVVVAFGSPAPDFDRIIAQLAGSRLKVQKCTEFNDLLSALRENVISLILLEGDTSQLETLHMISLIRESAADIPLVVADHGGCHLEGQWIIEGAQWVFPIGTSTEELLPALLVLIERYERLRSAEAIVKELHSKITSEHRRVRRFGRAFGELNHELNTPLAVIQGYCANLLDGILGALSKDQHDSVERIHFACNMMKDVVGRIKEELPSPQESPVPRIDPRSTQRRQIRISRLAEEVTSLFERSFAARDIRLVLEVDPQVHPIWADRARLSQLLVNLLSNAQRHTPVGGSTVVKVNSESSKDRDSCHVTVCNSGPPIPPEHLDEIFRPGWSQTDDPPGQRAGLGLAICKEIAEEHSARLTVESEQDQGTTFHLELPVDPRNRRRQVMVHLVQDETLSGQLLLELKKLSYGAVQLKDPPSMEVLAQQIHGSGLPLVLLGATKKGLQRVLKYLEQ